MRFLTVPVMAAGVAVYGSAGPDYGRRQDSKVYARVAWLFAKLTKRHDASIKLIVAGVIPGQPC